LQDRPFESLRVCSARAVPFSQREKAGMRENANPEFTRHRVTDLREPQGGFNVKGFPFFAYILS